MFQAGGGGEEGCGGGGAGEGGAPSGPSAATVVRTESHLARFNTARALFEKMGQGDARPQRTRTAAPATASLTNKAPPAKAEPEAPRGVAVRAGVGRGGDCLLSPQGDSLSPSSSRSASPSPARPAANGHAHHDDGSRGGLAGLGGLRRPGSASSRSLSASSTDSDPPGRRWPPSARAADPADPSRPAEQPDARRWPPHRAADPPHRAADPPRTNGEGTGVRRSSRPEKPAKPDTLADRRAAAASHDAHQELLARHKNWFQSFAKNRQSGPGRPPSPGKADPRPASPTKGEATRGEPRPEDWRAALNTTARTDLRSPRGGPHADDTTTTTAEDTTTTTTTPTTAPTITPTNNNITTAPLANNNNNNNNSTCLTTTTTTTTTTAASRVTASPPPPSAAAAGGGGGSSEQEAWTSVLQTRYGTRTRPDIYSPRLRGDSLDSSSGGGGGDWRRERAAILLGRSGQRHSTSEDDVVTKGYTRTLHHDAPAPHGPPAPPRFEDAHLTIWLVTPHKYGLAEGGKTTPSLPPPP
ncbi:integumentary mucin C.1-like [Eriocheir sinensis]|uniref:integumentary mucin C.1-like n=1 Tax=Eriocheir sinensis TaxID=95602 RepID=UPI0021C63342|nr:integumentary mucin C.1-like [Eriocheir sinensis]